jgi:transposase
MYQDEGRFGLLGDVRNCWVPEKFRPVCPLRQIRSYTYAYSAVSPVDGEVFSLILPFADTKCMSEFLKHLSFEYPEDFIILFCDGASWHKSESLEIPKNMTIAFQPPNSPELNPAEQLWKYLRTHWFCNRDFKTMDNLEAHLCKGLNHLIPI